jgi:hypothetical protein
VAPALSHRNLKAFFVSPLKKAKPKKRRLSRMFRGVSSRVFQKTRASVLQNRRHRIRNESLGLDDQTEPIGKRSPLDEFSDGLGETVWRNQFAFVLCKLF